MKVDRVILSCNYNPTYYQFWNPLSKLYKENFGIKPTLIFLGSEKELSSLNLSTEFGEIIRQDLVPSKDESWTTTWALFYYTKHFPEDVCLINGIDQIPLGSGFIIDSIKEISEDNYVMLIDDAYKLTLLINDWSELNGFSPSAYHIAKGKVFNEVYEFSESFAEEISKIESTGISGMWGIWGLDEAYFSRILYNKKNDIQIKCLSKFEELLNGGRIECNRKEETSYDVEKLRNNGYIECHSCRPYSKHVDYLNKMINNIPKFV